MRPQAALTLMIGRRFASAFVAVPQHVGWLITSMSNAGLSGLHARSALETGATAYRCSTVSGGRWLHAEGKTKDSTMLSHILMDRSSHSAGHTAIIRTRTRPWSSGVKALMMSSTAGATKGEEVCRAAHILCADERAADAALTRIENGEEFRNVAANVSSCASKASGGDLGWFKRGQMVAEFEAACFENDPGTLIKVQTQFGYHVIALLSRAILPRQMAVEELGKIVDRAKSGACGADSMYQLVDVREEGELKKARLDGFINLPLSKFEEWGPKLSGDDPILRKEKDTVVLCHHGVRSNNVAEHLAKEAGFKNVWNVEGGLHAYAKQVDPSVGTY